MEIRRDGQSADCQQYTDQTNETATNPLAERLVLHDDEDLLDSLERWNYLCFDLPIDQWYHPPHKDPELFQLICQGP
jgi:hypothetical protein